MGIRETIRNLDYFGYTPTFRIDGKDKLKSFISGFFTLIFLCLSISYLIYSILNYVSNLDRVATSRTTTQKITNYSLDSNDVYYGIGLVDGNEKPINITEFGSIQIKAYYIHLNKTTGITNSTEIAMTSCKREIFSPDIDFNTLDKKSQNYINSNLPFYSCPSNTSKFNLSINDYSQDSYTIRFKIDLINKFNSSQVMKKINELSPVLSFIYQEYVIDTNSRYKPYTQIIGDAQNEMGFYFSKTIEMTINPSNIYDDTNPLGSGTFNPVNISQYSSQLDGTIFTTSRESDFFRYFPNRDRVFYEDNNLLTVDVQLGVLVTTTLRTYRKFNDFVASVSSLMSTLLLAFGIFLNRVNSVKGVSNMIRSLYNYKNINNIREFRLNFKKIHNKLIAAQSDEEVPKKKIKRGFKGRANTLYRLKNMVELNLFKKKEENMTCLESDQKYLPITEFSERKINKSVSMKIDDKLEDILTDNFKFGFSDFIKMKLCYNRKKKANQLFENAILNIQDLLDINQYISFKFDMDMIKEVVLDKYQKSSFEIMSTMINFNRLFEYEKSKAKFTMEMNDNQNINHTILPLRKIYERKNETDKKIIRYFEEILHENK